MMCLVATMLVIQRCRCQKIPLSNIIYYPLSRASVPYIYSGTRQFCAHTNWPIIKSQPFSHPFLSSAPFPSSWFSSPVSTLPKKKQMHLTQAFVAGNADVPRTASLSGANILHKHSINSLLEQQKLIERSAAQNQKLVNANAMDSKYTLLKKCYIMVGK